MGTSASQGDKSLDVPSWFDRGGQAVNGASRSSAPVLPPPVPVGAVRPESGRVPPRREPILSVSAGRLVISLSQISAVVVVLAIIVLVAAAYMLGRRASQNTSAAPGGIKAPYDPATTRPDAGGESVNVLPVPVSHQSGTGGSGMVRDDAKRQKGYSYLVIQGGVQTPKEARDIKWFLYKKGINATVHRSTETGLYKVKDMKGFRDIRSAQTRAEIRAHVAQIERLGRKYKSVGRYDFKQSNSTVPWMETEN